MYNDEKVSDVSLDGDTDNRRTPDYVWTPDQVKDRIRFQEFIFDEIFADSKPGAIIPGPTEIFNITIENLRSFNFGIETGNRLFHNINNIINNRGGLVLNKLSIRTEILNTVYTILCANTASQSIYSSALTGTFTATNKDRRNKNMSEAVKLYDDLAKRNGKIGITDYEIKFSYRSKNRSTNPNDIVVFIDSEGLVFPLYPILDSDKSTLGEGIYVQKVTPESSHNEPFSVLPLPKEGECTRSDILNGVFFSSMIEFKEIYKREFKIDYDKSNENERINNIKKLVGRYLFNGVTETSHGLTSNIIGYSLTRKSFFTCASDCNIIEILNITPEAVGDKEFISILAEMGFTRELLVNTDYIVRKTNVGTGSGKTSSQNIKFEKIKVGRKTGMSEIASSLMDQDLALFNETGIAVFSTREAAERCIKHGGGDIEKYIQFITNKTSSKNEKHVFMDSIKNAALMGVGAAIPKLIEYAIKSIPKETLTMSIMKPMLPPLIANVAKSGILSGITSLISGILPVVNVINTISLGVSILKGLNNMNFFEGITNFVGSIFSKDSIVVKAVKTLWNGVVKLWKGCVSTFTYSFNKVKEFFGIIFSGNMGFMEKIKRMGGFFVNIGKDYLNFFVNSAKTVWGYAVKGFDKVCEYGKSAWNYVSGKVGDAWNWVADGVGGFFGGIFA